MSLPSSLCVFCGARFGANPANRGAAAALGAGGKVVGVIPQFLLDREAGHPALSETVIVQNMHERKLDMFERSEGFVVLPGGLGTLEEFFEVLSWRTLGLHDKPIVIIDQDGYWQPLHALLTSVVEGDFADRRYLDHVAFVTRIEDVLPAIEAMPRTLVADKKLDRL